jgi:hypothetical protein
MTHSRPTLDNLPLARLSDSGVVGVVLCRDLDQLELRRCYPHERQREPPVDRFRGEAPHEVTDFVPGRARLLLGTRGGQVPSTFAFPPRERHRPQLGFGKRFVDRYVHVSLLCEFIGSGQHQSDNWRR